METGKGKGCVKNEETAEVGANESKVKALESLES
jgi:hypothetical protein